MTFAELIGWEVEVLSITKDTTESDLKQRRDIMGDSVIFTDQAPVRAAMFGRLLILDGVENAERNVLPTLNNLLENREMSLEDGRFLMRKEAIEALQAEGGGAINPKDFVAVHPNFQVCALALPSPPYLGRPLDPPLRSRFQSRWVEELSIDDALLCLPTARPPQPQLQSIATVYETLRTLRRESVVGAGAGSISSLPLLSLGDLGHCL